MAAKLCPECGGAGELLVELSPGSAFFPMHVEEWNFCRVCGGLGYIKIQE